MSRRRKTAAEIATEKHEATALKWRTIGVCAEVIKQLAPIVGGKLADDAVKKLNAAVAMLRAET